jgi:O-antigen/teichoic acid export membrane protein
LPIQTSIPSRDGTGWPERETGPGQAARSEPDATGRARGPRQVIPHLLGAGAAKFAPPLSQFVLLLVVARVGTLDDVGLLALASASSFLCGALGDLGFSMTLSMPKVVFGTEAPPLRATRRLRHLSAGLGSLLYVALWAAGVGKHDPALLILVPLPYALSVAAGYSGSMNAAGKLSFEIPISIGESVVILAVTLLGSLVAPTLEMALLGLVLGRGLGLLARAQRMRHIPQSDVARVPASARAQLPYALATVAFVIQGQADMVVVGLFGALATAAVYGPLFRTAASTVLAAEGLSWSLFGGANPDEAQSAGVLARNWRGLMCLLGVAIAVGFVALAHPFLHFLLDRTLPNIDAAVFLFGGLIVARFVTLMLQVDILRAGRMNDTLWALLLSAVMLAGLSTAAALAGSFTGLAAARVVSEAPMLIGFYLIRRRVLRHEAR